VRSDLVPWLVCPGCRGDLRWDVQRGAGAHIIDAEARCRQCDTTYQVRDGVAALLPILAGEMPASDLWEQTEGQLSAYLRSDPDVRARLMDTPIDLLGPADRFLRAMALEEQGRFDEAAAAIELAEPGLYTAPVRNLSKRMLDEVAARTRDLAGNGPVVDLASGRGALLTRIAETGGMVVGTDASIRVLRRDQRWFECRGLAERVSMVAADMRHIPFRDASIGVLTTNLGLDNLSPPEALDDVLSECRRVTSGTFLAICQAEVTDDGLRWPTVAGEASEQHPILARLNRSGWWRAQIVASGRVVAEPTPSSTILEGVRIDAFPAAPATVEWALAAATRDER